MPIALTVFGIAARGIDPIFCYAFLRDVRGPGSYPKPHLPKDKVPNGTISVPIETIEELRLICWDVVLADGEATAAQNGVAQGPIFIPEKCPIQPGGHLTGQACDPVIVREGRAWVRSSGTGILHCRSMVTADGIDNITECLAKSQGIGRAPAAMLKLSELIAKHSGLDKVFATGRKSVLSITSIAKNAIFLSAVLFWSSLQKSQKHAARTRCFAAAYNAPPQRWTEPLRYTFRFPTTKNC